jgi:hypothetical protein
MRQLINEIKALAEKARQDGNDQVFQMLMVVSGSLLSGRSGELNDIMMAFARKDLERMQNEMKQINN